jgi:hypothetical protein
MIDAMTIPNMSTNTQEVYIRWESNRAALGLLSTWGWQRRNISQRRVGIAVMFAANAERSRV